MRSALLSLVCIVAWATGALAFQEPTGFRDVTFGTLESEFVSKYPDAVCEYTGVVERECEIKTELADAPIRVQLRFYGDVADRSFVAFSIFFRPRDYELIRRAFIDRYGAPTENVGTLLSWTGSASISLDSDPRVGVAIVQSKEAVGIEKKRAEERREKAKRGL